MLNNAPVFTSTGAFIIFDNNTQLQRRNQMTRDSREYMKAWYEAHRESEKVKMKAWNEANKAKVKDYHKAYYQAHKEQMKESKKAYMKEYQKVDVNSLGQTKHSIRNKSQRYLCKYGKKIEGYQIHHCCSYSEPYKFIYCSKEMHRLIHAYLRQHNIDADSDHYDQIKHLLDESAVLYGLER